jgi:hypothetical protein
MRGIKPWKVGVIQFIGVVLLPVSLDNTDRGFSFVSFAWRVDFTVTGPVFTFFHIQSPNIFVWVLFIAEIIFVRQMVRLYEQKTTGKRTFLAYLVAILPMIIFSVGNTLPILWNPRWPYAFAVIPLPLLLVLALITIFVYPPPGPLRVWIEEEEGPSWWKDKQVLKEPR